jgi:putative hemolysin
MHGLSLLQFVAVGLLILANAFFVAAEFALVSIRDTRIEQMLAAGVPGARAVRRLQRDLDDFLPAVQLGVTLCSLALGWIGEPLAASTLMSWMSALPFTQTHAHVYAHIIAVTLGFALITYFHVVVGELVPKSLALRRAEALAVAVAPPMLFFMALARPAVRLLKNSAALILRGFDIPLTERAQVHSPEELKLIATAARRLGVLPPFQETLIHRALELDDVPIREIMTPRQKIFSLPSNLPIEAATPRSSSTCAPASPSTTKPAAPSTSSASSTPKTSPASCSSAKSQTNRGCSPLGTGESKNLSSNLILSPGHARHPRRPRNQIRPRPPPRPPAAPPPDRHRGRRVRLHGRPGHRRGRHRAVDRRTGRRVRLARAARPPTAGGAVLMDGGLNLRDLETQMQWDLPRDGGVETLAGFVLMRLGHIPKVGESMDYEGRRLTVVEMDNRRIAKIRVEPVGEAPPTCGPMILFNPLTR